MVEIIRASSVRIHGAAGGPPPESDGPPARMIMDRVGHWVEVDDGRGPKFSGEVEWETEDHIQVQVGPNLSVVTRTFDADIRESPAPKGRDRLMGR